MRGLVVAALALLLCACSQTFDPVSNVEGFRVLDMRAEPPDLHPGDVATLDSLVVNPKDPSAPVSVLYLGCDPAPSVYAENPCARYQTVTDASQLLSPDGGLPPGAHFIGINRGSYTAPADLFSSVPADDLARKRGVLAVILGIALQADVSSLPSGDAAKELIQKVLTKQIPSQLIIKRIRISEDPELNHNPVLGLVADDEGVLRREHPLLVAPGQSVPLFARASEGAQEPYVAVGPDGTTDSRTETPVLSWFTSAGALDKSRTVDSDPDQFFTAPDGSSDDAQHAISSGRGFTLWVVLRDGRGGTDWAALPGLLCDPSLPAIELTSATTDGTSVTLSGAHLDLLVDASLDGQPLSGTYQAASGSFVARLPAGTHGRHPVLARGRSCSSSEATLDAP